MRSGPHFFCRASDAGATSAQPELSACPADATARPGISVTCVEAPREATDAALRLARAASIDIGGVEYLVSKADEQIYFYDINATSNFVANASSVLGFDPIARFADYIVRATAGHAKMK